MQFLHFLRRLHQLQSKWIKWIVIKNMKIPKNEDKKKTKKNI